MIFFLLQFLEVSVLLQKERAVFYICYPWLQQQRTPSDHLYLEYFQLAEYETVPLKIFFLNMQNIIDSLGALYWLQQECCCSLHDKL